MGLSLVEIIYFFIAMPIVLSVHECSHALAAYYLGDPTAKAYGRLTLNPLKHIDPVGTVVLPLYAIITGVPMFGWGKPVPVNPGNFPNPVRDSALTALAGPVSNFVLMFIFALPLKYLSAYLPGLINGLFWEIFNLSLAWGIFNLIPVPPLDGGKIIGFFVPKKYAYRFMRFQNTGAKYFVIFMLVDIFIFSGIFHFSIVQYVIMTVFEVVKNVLLFGM